MHDDGLHDRGLAFDLATLRSRALNPRLERRGALRVLAGAGAGLVLVACGADAKTATSSSTSTTSTTASGAAPTVAGATGVAIPDETAGPFPGDGSNGPNVLTQSGIVRRDIRSSFGTLSGRAEGVPLSVDLTVVSASDGKPMAGAALYLWHCDRGGGYSLYSSGVANQNYLRGVQEAGSDGQLSFTTVFPAAYSGRWPHIHFEVYPSLTEATSAGSRLVTSQLALPKDACDRVFATTGYEQSIANLAGSSLDTDMVFRDGYDTQLASVSGAVSAGLSASLVVPV